MTYILESRDAKNVSALFHHHEDHGGIMKITTQRAEAVGKRHNKHQIFYSVGIY